MRVLFSSTFGVGHNLPMVPLAEAFRDGGHDVRWATSADACALVESVGFEASPAGLAGAALRDRIGPLHAAVRDVPPPERAAFMFPRMFGGALTGPWPPTCCRSPEPGARTCSSTSTASWRRRWSERCSGCRA